MKLYRYQQEFLKDESRFRLVVKSRQVGFSTIIANEMVRDTLFNRKYLALCVSASERQAMHLLQYAYEQIRPLGPTFKEETKTSFVLANGSAVYSLPNNPATIRGFMADHVYLDEFAHFQNDEMMFQAILPSVSRGGRLTVCSTPMGKRGAFWRLYSDESNEFTRHKYPHTVCPELKIKGIKKAMDALSFKAEYCCEFVDESVSFFPYDLIMSCVDPSLPEYTSYQGSNLIYVGVDFGKLIDSTVIIALEKLEDSCRVLHVKEFRQTPFSVQLEYLKHMATAFTAKRIAIDATGYGLPLLEQSQDKLGARVEGITFTNAIKGSMITDLRVAFENGTIAIPQNDRLISQLHSLERTVSETGTVRYKHKGSQFDDYVWALALAFEGVTSAPVGISNKVWEMIRELNERSPRYETYEGF